MLLIIEKDPRFTAKLKKHLKVVGLRNFSVENVRDAMFLLKSMPTAFALVNLNAVADLNQLDELMAYFKGHQVPVLFIEGFQGTQALTAQMQARGGYETMRLPFKIGELARRIESLRTDRDPMVGKRIGPPGQEVEILRKIGAGAMGTVYEGHQLSLDRHVAVKVMAPDIRDEEAAARFLNEARAIARMRSAYIVQIIEVGTWEQLPFYVMEYIDGPTLDKYLRTKKILKAEEGLQLARQILHGLAEVHHHGKTHRDLKPANIMLNGKGEPVILDFGLVRDSQGNDLTRAGTVLGTPRYISPEQVTGTKVDHRADLYALGIMLFEMLIGKPPFEAASFEGVLLKHTREPLPLPEAFGRTLPPRVFALIQKLTEKQPSRRYGTAMEAVADVDACLSILRQGLSVTGTVAQENPKSLLNPESGLRIDSNGGMIESFGQVPQDRQQFLASVQSLLEKVTAVADMGPFHKGHMDQDDKHLLLFPFPDGLACLESHEKNARTAFYRLEPEELNRFFPSGGEP